MLSARTALRGFAVALSAALFACAASAADSIPSSAKTMAIDGSDVILKLWEGPGPDGNVVPHYSISLDGQEFCDPRPTSYVLKLRHGRFDPLSASPAPQIEPGFEADETMSLYIVQFVTQPLEEFRQAIGDLGGTVHTFLSQHAHIVKMDPDVRDAVEALPFVRWVGPFHPAYRLEEYMLDNAEWANQLFPLQKYNIAVFESGMAQKDIVADRIEDMGGYVDRRHAGKVLLEATLTPEQLFEVIRWDEVMFVDRWSPGEADMDIARNIGGANFIENETGFTGQGVRGEIIDLGFNLTHVDFQSRPLIQHTTVNTDSHGASCSGITFGDGTGNPQGRGMLPDGQGIVADWDVVSIGQPRYDHTGELVQDPYFAVFQTASVGSDRTTEYTNISADTDAALFDFDIVHCQSQSNSGWEDSRPQAWAKNIISGGGVYHYNTEDKDDDCWCSGASTGPATDGRVKPDLCSFYDDIFTTTSGSSTAYTSGFGGTSGATPIIAGHVGVFFQMWSEGVFGNPYDPNATVFENRCHMTTAKAALINTAEQYAFDGLDHDMTRVHQGWGMPDLERLYNMRYKMLIVDETEVLTNLGSAIYSVAVEPAEEMLKATLVYADPPGTPYGNQHRVNDLTLRVTSPSNVIYYGNNGLMEGNWSTPGGSPNEVDTVENVFVENPESGMWTVEVIAYEIIEDGHVETGQLDADFALVVTGVQETLPALVIQLPFGVPPMIPPGEPTEIEVRILEGDEAVVPGTETLHYRFDENDAFMTASLQHLGGEDYLAVLPDADCDELPQLYVSAEGDGGTVVTAPRNAPDSLYEIPEIGVINFVYGDDFENEAGWTVEDQNLGTGSWVREVPEGNGGSRGDPSSDYDGSGKCWVTGNDYDEDIDGGPTILTSSTIDLTGWPEATLSYARWFYNDDNDADNLLCEISNDDGATWVTLEDISSSAGWTVASFRVADFVTPNDQIRLRFSSKDNPNDSVTEAAIDALEFTEFSCDDACPEDVNGDEFVDIDDLFDVLAHWAEGEGDYDVNDDGTVDIDDVFAVLSAWGPC